MTDRLTTKQAAAQLGVAPSLVRRWCAEGRLPAEQRQEARGRVYYIAPADLQAFAAQPRKPGRPRPRPADAAPGAGEGTP